MPIGPTWSSWQWESSSDSSDGKKNEQGGLTSLYGQTESRSYLFDNVVAVKAPVFQLPLEDLAGKEVLHAITLTWNV